MADDHNQRPFRSNDPAGQKASAGRAGPAGTDPLAELARLIGQNDPFAEFGSDAARRRAAPRQEQPEIDWTAPPSVPGYPQQPVSAPQPTMPPPPQADVYHTAEAAPGYADAPADMAAYAQDPQYPYDPNNPELGPEEQDFYDDVPPRRRMGVLAIAAVFALAVIGTAGAFGYRALFGSSNSGPPPVIKADTTPSKIVPEKKDAASNKLIVDRVGGSGEGERLVSREEQPVEIKPAGVIPLPQGATAGTMLPVLGSGVVAGAGEPKKIRTIVIRPDQANMAAPSAPSAAPAGEPVSGPEPRVTNITPARPSPPAIDSVASTPSPAAAEPAPTAPPRQAVARAAPQPSNNAPLSLSPDASPAPVRAPAAPARIAPQTTRSGGYAVQLSSRRNEADAQAAFARLQTKYPSQLGGQQPLIRRVDLGQKGVYYRAMVGPFGSSDEANQLCASLKSAGGSCFVQRI